MRLLSRALFTFVLLGGLAFGSYAFGKYVLSSRLFGNKGSNLNRNFGESTVPRPSSGKGGSAASASVEILPEEGAGNARLSPPTSSNGRSAPQTTIDRSNTGGDDGSIPRDASAGIETFGSDSDSTPRRTRSRASSEQQTAQERPKKRRKRRPRPTPAPPNSMVRDQPVRDTYPSEPDVTISDEGGPSASNQDDSPAPRIEPRREAPREAAPSDNTPRDNTPREERPRRRRRVRVETPESAPRAERIEPRRERPREESPVPRPEGSDGGGGGESPVPIPE